MDILEDVCHAWQRDGLDWVECLRRATTVTDEWIYSPTTEGSIRDRLKQRVIKERTVPFKLKNLKDIIDAQPRALDVIKDLLDWISRVDFASQEGLPRPVFQTVSGKPIFPPQEEAWWLTDFQQRKEPEDIAGDEDGPPTEVEEEEKSEMDDEDPTTEEEMAEEGEGAKDPSFGPVVGWHCGTGTEGNRESLAQLRKPDNQAVDIDHTLHEASSTPSTTAMTMNAEAIPSPFMRACGNRPSCFD